MMGYEIFFVCVLDLFICFSQSIGQIYPMGVIVSTSHCKHSMVLWQNGSIYTTYGFSHFWPFALFHGREGAIWSQISYSEA